MCADDPLSVLARELAEHVAFRHRRGDSEFSFADALRGHRRIVLEALETGGGEYWLVRNGNLEKLAGQRGVDLSGEREVGPILTALREASAERRRTAKAAHPDVQAMLEGTA